MMRSSEDREARERALLGCLIADHRKTDEALSEGLKTSWFTGDRKDVFAALLESHTNGDAPNAVTLALAFPDLSGPGQGSLTLARWTEEGAADCRTLTRLLRDQVRTDRTTELVERIRASTLAGDLDRARHLAGELAALGSDRGQKVPLGPDSWELIATDLRAKPEIFRSRFKISTKGPEEDRSLTFPTGALSIVVAPSGHGKTTFLMNLLADAAKDHPEKRHWLFSFEEQSAVVYLKTFNAWAGKTYSRANMKSFESYFKAGQADMISGNMRQEFETDLTNFGRLVGLGTVTIKQGDFYAEDLIAGIRALANDRPGLVLIDYAQLLYQSNPLRRIERTEELKQICLALKDVAVETGLCLILAAQFNRQVIHASRMHMSNIADAADIERAASKILGLWNGNKGALLSSSEAKEGKAFDDAAGICSEVAGRSDGTIFVKILKDRTGISETWATYSFNGNQLHVDRTPVKAGRGDPRGFGESASIQAQEGVGRPNKPPRDIE